MWDRWKVRLCLVAAVVTLASACTDSGGDVESTPAARELMAGALGTQAVQDFLVHLDLSAVVDDELVSVMDHVREQSRSGSGAPLGLAGGMQLSPVEGWEASAADSAGEPLETVSIDFGLLDTTGERSQEIHELIAASVAADSPSSIPEDLFDGEQDGALLVQIITASYEEAWTHVGPDDTVTLDASFLSPLNSASEFVSAHIFGQTMPGDPGVESGMTAHELFAYRWNEGLISLAGGDEGPHIIFTVGDLTGSSEPSSRLPQEVITAGVVGDISLEHGLRLAAESPESDTGEPSPDAEESPRLGPGARFAAKTILRMLAMSAGFHAGSERARELIDKSLAIRGGTVHVREHCLNLIPIPDSNYKIGVVMGTPDDRDGCDPKVAMLPEGYATLWALREQHTACILATRILRRMNNPSSSQPTPAATGTSTTVTTDPLFDTTTTIPDLPPCVPPWAKTPGGGTVGDVHMVTFDGDFYDNQAAGEFLVFEGGDAVVQMRTEPWPLSDVASVVTAVAVGVGDARVSMHEGGSTWVDGDRVDLERGAPVEVGGGSVVWSGVGWVVVGPDGTEVHVADNRTDNGTMHFIVHPVDDDVAGMLGDWDGDPSNDLVGRGGEVLTPGQLSDSEQFYGIYLDSWRITPDESLFHYGDGESTEGFQLMDFPVRWIDFGDLDQVAKGDAEAVCREGGVTRPDLLAACIYDIVVTGDPGFAYDAFVFQETLPAPKDRPAPTSPSTSTPPPSGDNFLTIGGQTIAFEGFAAPGSCSISEDSPGVSLPGFLGEATTVDAAGREVAIRIEFYALDDPFLVLTVLRDGRPYAWMWEGRPESGSVEEASMAGNSLTVTGTAFLNDPEDPELHPMIPLPAGTPTVPFHLQATCDR